MNWLAFDTSTDILSVAVSRDGRVWSHDSPGGAQASTDGLPTVLRLMQEAQLQWSDLQAIVMGRGPGAFTGLRTACAMAQGLAWGAGLKVLPIDTLLAVAETACGDAAAKPAKAGNATQPSGPASPALEATRWMVVMDARMSQVYAAAYERTATSPTEATWQCVQAPALLSPQELLPPAAWVSLPFASQPCVIAGNAHTAYAQQWPVALSDLPTQHAMPSAQALIRLAPQAWAQGLAVPPEEALPLYIRDKVAQTTAERQAQRDAA
jgi:tRNA threonylcarbamoyladenosine biosynthesis protein TsaB